MARITSAQRKTQTDFLEIRSRDVRTVQGLTRGLSVLRAFQPGDISLSNSELALRVGLPKSTVSRLTQTLAAHGYLMYLSGVGRYMLGAGIVALCHSLLAGMPLRLAAKPEMQKLADFTRLPVSLGMRDRLDILYIETAMRRGLRAARFQLGARLPIETTSIGRAYLYALPTDERDMVIERLRQERGSDWHSVRAGIEAAFESVTKRGFCCSYGEWRPDVFGVAAPIVGGDGPVFALNCGGAPLVVSPDFLEQEVGPRLAEAANRIAKRLCSAPPT